MHDQVRVHAAQVVARHVAEEDVAAGCEVDVELADAVGLPRLEGPDLGSLDGLLADGQTVAAPPNNLMNIRRR